MAGGARCAAELQRSLGYWRGQEEIEPGVGAR